MTFDDFLPYVQPYVSGCPRDTALHHIKLAAIEFCERSCIWRESFDTLLADGFSASYALPLDDQVELAKLLEVKVQDGADARAVEADIVEVLQGRRIAGDGCSRVTAWTDNRRDVFLTPTPREDAQIDVYAAIKPALTAFSFPDDVFRHHAEHIAFGALARLFEMPGVDWSSPLALVKREQFDEQIGKAARKAERGFGRRRRSKAERFF